ncbi:MAG: hypothetical protein HN509_09745 [Halobacteriovoraceae bacterium]|jgi:hypothetical protein|nr:hypothetical protein [Halobacteriovoraceae bacterium]MBT5095586.1 hypothetical protein [Halobacteriovoraceae bacterium]
MIKRFSQKDLANLAVLSVDFSNPKVFTEKYILKLAGKDNDQPMKFIDQENCLDSLETLLLIKSQNLLVSKTTAIADRLVGMANGIADEILGPEESLEKARLRIFAATEMDDLEMECKATIQEFFADGMDETKSRLKYCALKAEKSIYQIEDDVCAGRNPLACRFSKERKLRDSSKKKRPKK